MKDAGTDKRKARLKSETAATKPLPAAERVSQV